jgi:DNA processing protein
VSREDRLRLALAGLHPARQRALVEEHGSAGGVLAAIRAGRVSVSRRARSALAMGPHEVGRMLEGLGVAVCFRGGDGYPAALEAIIDPPDVLFVQGVIPAGPAVAVVGTRRCTGYGRGLARSYGAAVAAAGWATISGLARGIDAEAHRGTVEAGGRGVAVLGSGSNVVYPPEHRDLHRALLNGGGAVVTEYPPGTPPQPWRFPPRNRIIAGLARATVVVEAAVTGGALITAGLSADQGKPVLAVPGDVGRGASEGSNLLIRDGAIPVLGPDDLIEELSLILGPPAVGAGRTFDPERGDGAVLSAMGPAGASVEQVVEATGFPAAEVLAAVARLEAAGAVTRSGGRVVPTFGR